MNNKCVNKETIHFHKFKSQTSSGGIAGGRDSFPEGQETLEIEMSVSQKNGSP